MKLMLMACIFFAGVYCGLFAEPEGELFRVAEHLRELINCEPEW
jgi:hypothetical protein